MVNDDHQDRDEYRQGWDSPAAFRKYKDHLVAVFGADPEECCGMDDPEGLRCKDCPLHEKRETNA